MQSIYHYVIFEEVIMQETFLCYQRKVRFAAVIWLPVGQLYLFYLWHCESIRSQIRIQGPPSLGLIQRWMKCIEPKSTGSDKLLAPIWDLKVTLSMKPPVFQHQVKSSQTSQLELKGRLISSRLSELSASGRWWRTYTGATCWMEAV